MKYAKGTGPVVAEFAAGGPMINTSRSRFFKEPDVFRTDIERTDYEKKSPGGEMSKTTGDKSLPPVKPRT
jgi:hypothetical protein